MSDPRAIRRKRTARPGRGRASFDIRSIAIGRPVRGMQRTVTDPRGRPAYLPRLAGWGDGADGIFAGPVEAWRQRPVGPGDPGFLSILRKEVIQPQVPLRLPCYDLVPITGFIFGACLAAPTTSDAPRFGGLTGGVYKAQEHIHRRSADRRLLAIPASCGRVAARNPNWGSVLAIGAASWPGDALSAPL